MMSRSMSQEQRRLTSWIYLILGTLLTTFVFRHVWRPGTAYCLWNEDNMDLVYPVFHYIQEELKERRFPAWNPLVWCGVPLAGNPNFNLSPLHIVAATLLDAERFVDFLGAFAFLEILIAFWGFYALCRAHWPERPPSLALCGAIFYVLNTGFGYLHIFFSLGFHFSVIPWVLWAMRTASSRSRSSGAALIAILLCFQGTWGQMQFTIYSGFLYLFYLCFAVPRETRNRAAGIFVWGGLLGAGLAAYFLFPLADNILLGGIESSRLKNPFSPDYHRVPWQYLLRLFYPDIFFVPRWWPIKRDGWSVLESFSVFQSTAVSVTFLYGLLFARGCRFWKIGWLVIAFMVMTDPGLYVARIFNLGSNAPYGRLSNLLVFFSLPIVLSVISQLRGDRKKLLSWGVFQLAWVLFMEAFVRSGIYEWFVMSFFQAADRIADAPEVLRHASTHRAIMRSAHIFLLFGGCLAIAASAKASWPRKSVIAALPTLILLASVYFAGYTQGLLDTARTRTPIDHAGVFRPHPLENNVRELLQNAPFHRVHIEIPFGAQRTCANETRRFDSPTGVENRFRLQPNGTMLGRIPITTGYTSVVPHDTALLGLIAWRAPPGSIFRAVGPSPPLRPEARDILAARYIIRHQGMSPPASDDGRLRFVAAWDGFQLYEANGVPPIFHIPSTLVVSPRPVPSIKAVTAPAGGSVAVIGQTPYVQIDFPSPVHVETVAIRPCADRPERSFSRVSIHVFSANGSLTHRHLRLKPYSTRWREVDIGNIGTRSIRVSFDDLDDDDPFEGVADLRFTGPHGDVPVETFSINASPAANGHPIASLFDNDAHTWWEPMPESPLVSQEGRVLRIDKRNDEHFEIFCECAIPSYLVLGIPRHRWWKARINDIDVPIEKANGLFGAVRLPAGTSTVSLRCDSKSLKAGFLVSGATLSILVGVWIVSGIRRSSRSPR